MYFIASFIDLRIHSSISDCENKFKHLRIFFPLPFLARFFLSPYLRWPFLCFFLEFLRWQRIWSVWQLCPMTARFSVGQSTPPLSHTHTASTTFSHRPACPSSPSFLFPTPSVSPPPSMTPSPVFQGEDIVVSTEL